MTSTQEATEGERLARVEATLDSLVVQVSDIREDIRHLRGEIGGFRGEMTSLRGEMNGLRGEMNGLRVENEGLRIEMRDIRRSIRTYFFWILGILLGVLTPSLIGLIVTLAIKL